MRPCEVCGTEVPVIEMHTAADGGDVCPDCCDICNKPSEETAMAKNDHILGAHIHMDAHTITVRSRAPGAVFINLDVGTSEVCISGTLAEVRAVAWAMLGALDEIEGEGSEPILSEEAAVLSPENPEAA